MISVTIELYDSQELALVHQLTSILEQKRQTQAAANHAAMQGSEDAADAAAAAEHDALHAAYGPHTDATKPVEPEAPIATIVAPGKAITLADMEKAAQTAIQIGGLAQVRGIVNQYTAGKIKEVAPEHWPELMAKLKGVTPQAAGE